MLFQYILMFAIIRLIYVPVLARPRCTDVWPFKSPVEIFSLGCFVSEKDISMHRLSSVTLKPLFTYQKNVNQNSAIINSISIYHNVVCFLGSTEPRSPREPHIKFRIGQVIQHKRFGYRGVIVGWDPIAKVSMKTTN